MWSVRRPTESKLREFIARESALPFSYPNVGGTQRGEVPAGFASDLNRVELGRGEEIFQRACDSLKAWKHFETGWTRIVPEGAPVQTGQTIGLVIRALGVWWWNSARIVYTIDEPKRFAFAYGTLPGHVERGEEQFAVEISNDGTVWYTIRAFSRPRILAARMANPLARMLQRQFVRDSKWAMRVAVGGEIGAAC
jgi:uncharacterized protein (UPF0548 family)